MSFKMLRGLLVLVMPGRDPGILGRFRLLQRDGRVKPGHDG